MLIYMYNLRMDKICDGPLGSLYAKGLWEKYSLLNIIIRTLTFIHSLRFAFPTSYCHLVCSVHVTNCIACPYWPSHPINNTFVSCVQYSYVCVMCIQLVFIHTHGHTMKSNPHCCNPVKCYVYFCIESGNSMVLQALSFSKLVQWLNLLRRPPSSNSGCRHLCSFIFHVYYIKVHYSSYLCDIYW